jgi:type III secretory pathway component EscV
MHDFIEGRSMAALHMMTSPKAIAMMMLTVRDIMFDITTGLFTILSVIVLMAQHHVYQITELSMTTAELMTQYQVGFGNAAPCSPW